MRQGVGRDARAGIDDGQSDVFAGANWGVSIEAGAVERADAGLDLERSAVRHGFFSIGDEVHDALFDELGIGEDKREIAFERQVDMDRFAGHDADEAFDVADGVIEINVFGVAGMVPAEGKELAGERSAAIAGAFDFFDVVANRVAILEVDHGESGVTGDGGEEVVEIVGDAAGEATGRVEGLGFAAAIFDLESVSDVDAGADDVGKAAVLVAKAVVGPGDNAGGVIAEIPEGLTLDGKIAGQDVEHLAFGALHFGGGGDGLPEVLTAEFAFGELC